MNRREQEALIERVASAERARAPDGTVRPEPGWRDLEPEARRAAARAATTWRTIEAALDPEGLSSTVRAVLARIEGSA